MVALKDSSVKPKNISPEIVFAILVADRVFRDNGVPLIITSLNDGHHSVNSLHYIGRAVDLRSKHIPSAAVKSKILEELKKNLTHNVNYDILFEYEGTENEHFHIEYDPK